MRSYEELFITKVGAAEEEVNALLEQLSGVITESKGTVNKVDKWPTRRLAYAVGKETEGNYILMEFTTPDSQAVRELERRLRVSDLVIKSQTVRMDERMRRVVKRQKRREKRLARKPQLAAPPPAAPDAPAVPAAPLPAAPLPAAPLPAAPAPAAPAAENTAAE